jgi:hypothetical protein
MKLTNETRKIILNRLIAHRFNKARDKLLEREYALAEECYEAAFDAKIRATLEALPEGWTPRRTLYQGKVAGCWTELCFKTSKPWPYDMDVPALSHPAPVVQAVLDFLHDRKEHAIAREAAANHIKGALSIYTTMPKLVAAWPEVEPFVYGLGQAHPNLPAIQAEKLNAMLDLPVETKNDPS